MEVRFLCLQGGRKYYSVLLNGESIFVGTRAECARFTEIHQQKVDHEMQDLARTPRSRPVAIRTYRQTRLQA